MSKQPSHADALDLVAARRAGHPPRGDRHGSTALAKERRLSPKTVEAYAPRPAPVPGLPDHASRRAAEPCRDPRPQAPGHPRLPGGPAHGGGAEPLAHAPARGPALLRPPPGAGGPWHRLGLRGDPHPEGGQDPAAPALRRVRGRGDGCRDRGPARTASPGSWPATPPCSPCSTARACASPRRSGLQRRDAPVAGIDA